MQASLKNNFNLETTMNIKEILDDYIVRFEIDPDYARVLTAALDKILINKSAADRLNYHIYNYKDGNLDWDGITADSKIAAKACGIHEYTAALIFYISLTPYALPYFEAHGLGYTEWYDSMIDLKWKLDECVRVYGIVGVFTDWFKSFYLAERVTFGRLQFNFATMEQDYKSAEFDIHEGERVISVHIPADTRTPFNKENREAAYKKAAKYYAPYFKGGEVVFRCASWLLHPAHREILPEHSNIRDFLSDFELDESSFKARESDIWRIFDVKEYNGNPEELPEKTSLMKAYKGFLLNGGTAGYMTGYRKEKAK